MLPLISASAAIAGAGWLVADLDPLSGLQQYGILGIVVIALLTGWIVPGPASKQKENEIQRLLAENQRLQGMFEEHIIPMTAEYARSMQESSRVMGLAIEALKVSGGST